jgi:5'-nucleotidase
MTIRRLILLVIFLAGWLCEARRVNLQILQTTDIHGHILHGKGTPKNGGWLRLGTLIRRQRREFGLERTLLIDCGDTCQGTSVATHSRGQICVDLLQALDYDIWVPGNHDLDYGVRRFHELCRQLPGRVLNGNVGGPNPRGNYPIWRLVERCGVRIAIIGINSAYLRHWLWGAAQSELRIEPGLSAIDRAMQEIHRCHPTPDLIVLAAHQAWQYRDKRGINEIAAIVKRYPEIDLVLGGHTHREVAGMKLGPRTWYVQAGAGADCLAVIKLALTLPENDNSNRRLESTIVDISSELLRPSPDTPTDPQALEKILPRLRGARLAAKTVIGTLKHPISSQGRPGENCQTSEFLCQAIGEAVDAEIVIHGKLSGTSLSAGPVTEQDLFDLVPYQNQIGTAWLTRAELTIILREQWQQRQSSAYCGIRGAKAILDRRGMLTSLRLPDGTPLPVNRRFKTALNSYTIAGAGGRFPLLADILQQPEARLQDSGLDTRQAVRLFLKKHPGYRPTKTRAKKSQ